MLLMKCQVSSLKLWETFSGSTHKKVNSKIAEDSQKRTFWHMLHVRLDPSVIQTSEGAADFIMFFF